MDWTDNEVEAMWKTCPEFAPPPTVVRKIATCAVELVQARGGTMTAERIADLRESMASLKQKHPAIAEEIGEALRHTTSQGSTVATLQAKVAELEHHLKNTRSDLAATHRNWVVATNERDALRAEVERLRADIVQARETAQRFMDNEEITRGERDAARREGENLKRQTVNFAAQKWERRANVAESRLAAIRERLRDMAHEDDTDAPVPAEIRAGWHAARKHLSEVLESDAPQEAKELVKVVTLKTGMVGGPTKTDVFVSYPCSDTCTHDDAATPGHPERVKERSEAVVEATARADQAFRSYGHGAEDGYQEGAEAMRAACWEAVRHRLWNHGLYQYTQDFKAAIEGAAP